MPQKVNKYGFYIGILNINGSYNQDEIPGNVLSNLAWLECLLCKNKWNACYNGVNNGVWCPNCAGNTQKKIEDYINLPGLMSKNGKYIGLLEDENYNINKFPNNIHCNSAYWECSICNYKWNARYNDIQKKFMVSSVFW